MPAGVCRAPGCSAVTARVSVRFMVYVFDAFCSRECAGAFTGKGGK